MNEKLVEALMHLFAVIAKEDSVTAEEVSVVRSFLQQQLTHDSANHYLGIFERFASETQSETVEELCHKVNSELTQKQKIIVIVRLIELVNADKSISQVEQDAIHTAADILNIKDHEYKIISDFVLHQTPKELVIPEMLSIGDSALQESQNPLNIFAHGFSGYISVLRIPSVETYILRFFGEQETTVNGLALLPDQVYFFAPGSVIRYPKHNPIYYSDVVSRFLSDDKQPKVVFEADKVTFRFPNGKIGLHNINIREESGKLIGLMGASGAGKSTLLNVLNGSYKPSSGEIRINSINIHQNSKATEGVIGYVSQDDLLMEDLTVYENLYYNAKLCFDKLSPEELDKLTLKTLQNLGLLEAKDLKVGNPLNKKISGGQRKRLNIGLELIREPGVLFVDEPTSGLSSRDSENIMDLLKELSLRGKLIFVVIHQPSSDIFKMFDKLFIMDVGGYPIYYGNPVEAVSYFKAEVNHVNAQTAECSECGNVNPEQIFNIIETKVLDENGNFTNQRKISSQEWYERFLQKIKLPEVSSQKDKPISTLSIPNWWKQCKVFITRDVLSKISNTSYLVINFLEAPLLALVLAFIVRYYNTDASNTLGYNLYENLNLPAYMFMCILVALFMGLTVSAEEILRDRRILKREAFLNLSRQSYLLSKILILFVVSAIQTFSFVIIGNTVLSLSDMTVDYWLVLFTVSCFANMLGLNISATFDSAVTIYILIPILLIPQIILSGVIVRFDKLNPAIASVGSVPLAGEMMASRWAYEALAVNQFKSNDYEKNFYTIEKRMSEAQYKQNYWLRKLESKIDFCLDHIQDPKEKNTVTQYLSLIKEELTRELSRFSGQKFPFLEDLTPEKFTEKTAQDAREVFTALHKLYSKKFNEANADKDKKIQELGEGNSEKFLEIKMKNHNESLADLVTNKTDNTKILEIDNKLIQQMDPIFLDPQSISNPLDFRTHFFAPTKHFLGKLYDTFSFNLLFIWVLSVVMYITLYFETFRWLIDKGSNLAQRKKF
ncbi:MAG: ATP-binding cassette domain-containing protein [Bacteroidia bacterium]|nr:ATP-binding cassette domain-containing protein [Bacteroidia bacterium]